MQVAGLAAGAHLAQPGVVRLALPVEQRVGGPAAGQRDQHLGEEHPPGGGHVGHLGLVEPALQLGTRRRR